jgi:hypothetical protein
MFGVVGSPLILTIRPASSVMVKPAPRSAAVPVL